MVTGHFRFIANPKTLLTIFFTYKTCIFTQITAASHTLT